MRQLAVPFGSFCVYVCVCVHEMRSVSVDGAACVSCAETLARRCRPRRGAGNDVDDDDEKMLADGKHQNAVRLCPSARSPNNRKSNKPKKLTTDISMCSRAGALCVSLTVGALLLHIFIGSAYISTGDKKSLSAAKL